MESRLPKPKFNLSKIVSTENIKTNNQKMPKYQNDLPDASSNHVSDNLKKTKSTINIAAKCKNENKPPTKQILSRSKTMSSITTRAMKRPANAPIIHGETKKPFTKPPIKPKVMQRTGTTLTSNTISKSSQDTTNKKVQNNIVTKPSKWDLKGRLAHTSDELSSVRQKYKETLSKYNEIQEQLNILKTNENACKIKAEEYENLNKTLNNELNELKIEINKMQEEKENLKKCLKDTEESFKNVSKILEEFKEKCISQETLLLKREFLIKDLETNLEAERKINEKLTTDKNDLQSLVHTMDKDRRILHNAIQEMKGNIRVFCRVRPRTPNEFGKPYVSYT